MNYAPVSSKYIDRQIHQTPKDRRYITGLIEMRQMLMETPRNAEAFVTRFLLKDGRYYHDLSELEAEIAAERKIEREAYRESSPHEMRETTDESRDTIERCYVFRDRYGSVMDGRYELLQRKTGVRISEGSYKNGDRDGPWTYYYATGEKWFACSYKNGLKNGQEITWEKNGEIQCTETYKKDMPVREGKTAA